MESYILFIGLRCFKPLLKGLVSGVIVLTYIIITWTYLVGLDGFPDPNTIFTVFSASDCFSSNQEK